MNRIIGGDQARSGAYPFMVTQDKVHIKCQFLFYETFTLIVGKNKILYQGLAKHNTMHTLQRFPHYQNACTYGSSLFDHS